MSKVTNILLGFILLLVLLNLALTGSLLLKQTPVPTPAVVNDRVEESLDALVAQVWGKKVIDMYNGQEHQALYALFNDQAKVKISHKQLETQLKKLYQLFGEIEESAFVSANKIGEKGNERYYKLLFNIRVKETGKRSAALTISVIVKDNIVSLYGVRLNASQSLE
ncbi:hypothetical protein CXF72_17295 [Psychromonas sp. MB-3u-54]|uniref:hypothetical protein n=1 Tax=Psychromonas sp. MB-3u-54 TaxID=2058319 RepID=UPI000C343CE7|nr:hypothetical protein [Psychromonas sp. MB-3u-54]PKH01425.1 hypothetical protein CXF72_17295 [Psychromonas sp. MB-3u-54]